MSILRRVIPGAVAGALLAVMPGCHVRGGEPSARNLEAALRAEYDRMNAAGGMVIDTGNAGSFTRLKFMLELHDLTKKSCVSENGDHLWKCEVTVSMTYPPLDEPPKDVDQTVVIFDAPDGWRVVP